MFWPSSRGGWIEHLKTFLKLFGEWIIFIENYSRWYVKQTTKVQKQFQLNINQPDTINCNQKTVLEKLNQEIKESDQLQVYNDLLIKEVFVKQYKLC